METAACSLYLITPAVFEPRALAEKLAPALEEDILTALQLRMKDVSESEILRAAEILLPLCRAQGVTFILNDSAELAAKAGADGVHLGIEDKSVASARALLGEKAVIGASCYDSKDRAFTAGEEGADYVAFGAFYPTKTKTPRGFPKPDLLEWWCEHTVLPVVAIGGITPANCSPLVQAGADYLAVVSAVWEHPESPAAAVREFGRAIRQAQGG